MLSMWMKTAAIATLLATATTAYAARDVNVVVGEMGGNVIAGARVCLGLSENSNAEGYAETDAMGVAHFENVPGGSRTYYLSVTAPGVNGQVRQFQIMTDFGGGMGTPQVVNVSLPGNGATCTPPAGANPGNGLPAPPVLQEPRDGATKVSNRMGVRFKWDHAFLYRAAQDPSFDREENHFRVCITRPGQPCNQGDSEQCALRSSPIMYARGRTGNSWRGESVSVPPLLRGGPVEWSVAACNARGCRWSTPRTLTVTPIPGLRPDSSWRLYSCRECRNGGFNQAPGVNRHLCSQRIPRNQWIDQTGQGGGNGGGSNNTPPPANDPAGAIVAFNEIADVFIHPRCTNCHVEGSTPRQGDYRLPHEPDRRQQRPRRGERCTDCHSSNPIRAGYEHAPVPPSGPQTWHLAPISMAFESSDEVDGLKRAADICRSIKAAAGSPQNVVRHVNVDNLVKWAFDPGAGRTPAHPRGHSYFVDKLREWADKGGACPD